MKKIIVIGATSNVGSYFTFWARDYFAGRYEIVATGRKHTDFFERNGIKYVNLDLTKETDFAKLPREEVHAVVLMAAAAPSYMVEYDPKSYLEANIVGTFNALEYCRKIGVDRMLFMTTSYDTWLTREKDHNTIIHPDSPLNYSYTGDHAVYVISKNAGVELMEHYYQEYGLKKFIFRFTTIYNYSPYHYYYPHGKKTLRPVYRMIENAMASRPIEVWGDGKYAKNMVYVADCSQMLCKAIEVNREKGFYNVGTGIPVTLEEQARTIVDVFSPKDNPSEIVFCPDKKVGGGSLMDIENAKMELGYEPKYDCHALFEEYKKEMKLNRFAELLMRE